MAIFLFPAFQLLDAAGPITAFEIASEICPGAYYLTMASLEGGEVRSSSGVCLRTLTAAEVAPVHTIVVVGGEGSRTAMNCLATRALLAAHADRGGRICGVCSGAFLLAGAGILNGRRATTHWRRAEQLARSFPKIIVEPDRIHVRDGAVWTSAGISAGIDLALALIAEDLGEAVARRVAQEMVVYFRRPGGQSQFSALAAVGGDATRFSPLLEWVRANLLEKLTVERLSAEAAMSPRNFSRAFSEVIGMSPAKAVRKIRLEVARERVEGSDEPIELIAAATGFNDPERMRRAFVDALGQPPQALRRSARTRGAVPAPPVS